MCIRLMILTYTKRTLITQRFTNLSRKNESDYCAKTEGETGRGGDIAERLHTELVT